MDSLAAASDACMIYITAGTGDEARVIARALVDEKLVACANILGPATSIYTWNGATEEAQEFVLICKTGRAMASQAAARAKALHSYATPCITVYDMAAAYPPYLQWIMTETGRAG